MLINFIVVGTAPRVPALFISATSLKFVSSLLFFLLFFFERLVDLLLLGFLGVCLCVRDRDRERETESFFRMRSFVCLCAGWVFTS